ncbi:MAG: DNA polymerase III subunit delta' [candidate division KSB1 bacterium]|nr:DNA polymerase III subunit delta' [candidate division KSB1 bacterium]MDZ7273176.1 DNA polymerase III subunit delta' [candidate division KSB1 bacterium]MDZ7285278.1 DNA polymerase III subunit delta' [candidate division KSB1 bacterium]MDZ7298310.1 DNA polymerase III subunit delta' [candidate division KSB1 bacterium]MDZ7307385.1 DNA polymerase III subunit delta' [candidate division KSB1 bacterium]
MKNEHPWQLADIPFLNASHAVEVLRRARQHQRLAHAYLLHGPEGAGKEALALYLAQGFLCTARSTGATAALFAPAAAGEPLACGQCSACRRIAEMTHPDLHLIFPRAGSATEKEMLEVLQSFAAQPWYRSRPWENSFILIDDIRELKRKLAITSYEGTGAVVLLLEAHRLKAESANALLKILEEPPPNTYFLLTAVSVEGLLPTILSRCQPLAVPPVAQQEMIDFLVRRYGVAAERAALVAAMAGGNLREALALLGDDLESRRRLAVEFMRAAFKFNKPVEQMDFLSQLTNEHDRQELQQLLRFCLVWVRDACVIKACGPGQRLVNADLQEALLALVKNLPHFDFAGVIDELEYALDCLERYVQPWLVLMVLLHRINQLARPGR